MSTNEIVAIISILIVSIIVYVALFKHDKKRIEKNKKETNVAIEALKRRFDSSPILYKVMHSLEENLKGNDSDSVINIFNRILPIKVPTADDCTTDIVDNAVDKVREFTRFLINLVSTIKDYQGDEALILNLRPKIQFNPSEEDLESLAEQFYLPKNLIEKYKEFLTNYFVWEQLVEPPCLKTLILKELENMKNGINEIDSVIAGASQKGKECGLGPCEKCFKNPDLHPDAITMIYESLVNPRTNDFAQ